MASIKEVAHMMPGEERPCCDNCVYLRGDYEDCNCAHKLNFELNEMYDHNKYPDADEVLELIKRTAVDRGDECPFWRWYGDE